MKIPFLIFAFLGLVTKVLAILIAYDAPIDRQNIFTAAADQAKQAVGFYQISQQSLEVLMQITAAYREDLDPAAGFYEDLHALCAESKRFIEEDTLPLLESIALETQGSIESRLLKEAEGEGAFEGDMNAVRDDLEFLHSYHEQGINMALSMGKAWSALIVQLQEEAPAALSSALTQFLTQFGEGNQNLRVTHGLYKRGLDSRRIGQSEQLAANGLWWSNTAIIVGTTAAIVVPLIVYWAYKYGHNSGAMAAAAMAGQQYAQRARVALINNSGPLRQSLKNIFDVGAPMHDDGVINAPVEFNADRRASTPF